MSKYIYNLIEQGENLHLDFKFEISDSKKLAKSFAAFANTDGGKLLVGVKDNGNIAGVRTDEELYMLEAAAHLYCKPKVLFTHKNWQVEGKWIIEVDIPKSNNIPHYAKNNDEKWLAYVRVNDQNLLVNNVQLKVWKSNSKQTGLLVKYTKQQKLLFDYLARHPYITLNRLKKMARLKHTDAENMLSNLIVLDILDIVFTDKLVYYTLKNKKEEQ